MTWMIIRLILSLAFIGGVLLFAARLAKKRGLGQGSGLIEVVARQMETLWADLMPLTHEAFVAQGRVAP